MSEEIIIINDEPFYKIPNGTSYDYAPIPKEFKPYFERLQQENEQLKNNWNELKKSIENDIKEYEESEFHIKEPPISIQTKINILIQMQELEGNND